MGLQPDEAVDDVDARLFEDARPFDVGLLVEAGLQLDEGHDLLARRAAALASARTIALSVPAVR